ncbi:MAG: peptide deformylase [Mycobacteriales bacterium]
MASADGHEMGSMKLLRRTRFGDPVLRLQTRSLTYEEILSPETQELIQNMRYTVEKKRYGVGLAAPQVGKSLAISVIGIKATPTRPNLKPFDATIINPAIVETFGKRTGLWEGCISCGVGNDVLYAKALRYKKVRVRWQDERTRSHEAVFEGIVAHVLQHEIDHLNGVLFVDRVRDNKTMITIAEYKKHYLPKAH